MIQGAAQDGALQRALEVALADRFFDDRIEAIRGDIDTGAGAVGGNRQKRDIGAPGFAAADPGGYFGAAHAGHVQVQKSRIELGPGKRAQSGGTVGNLDPEGFQEQSHHHAIGLDIVGDQNSFLGQAQRRGFARLFVAVVPGSLREKGQAEY
jgi:hypothetical protein